ncbi:MAG: hypothetical protein IMZ55_05175 [Acidobacteria bacterium]|nr:hypothetical protein [Acidobacteriota bacterium]
MSNENWYVQFPGGKKAELDALKLIKGRKPQVFVGMAHYEGRPDIGGARALFSWASQGTILDTQAGETGGSLLGRSFNALWAYALTEAKNNRVTHFAMLHGDCEAGRFWVDTLMEELIRTEADVCATVIGIKDNRGLTSVAVDNPANEWQVYRRLTMHEVYEKLPETFSADDVVAAGLCPPGHLLLANTGCWLADIRKPFWYRVGDDGSLLCHFEIRDRIHVTGEHKENLDVQVIPEDWGFSRTVGRLGGKVVCTRKVPVDHVGRAKWSNQAVYGQWKHDEECLGPAVKAEPATNEQGEPTHGDQRAALV